jgi:hypothetical protein
MPRPKPPPPRGASSAHTRNPAQSPRRSLAQAILQFLGRIFLGSAVHAIKLWILVVDAAIWCLRWIWKNPWKSTKTFVNIFFRLATLVSVGYLVADRIYETNASISSPAPDPRNPLDSPFTITNNSHIFTIRNVEWYCYVHYLNTKGTDHVLNEARLFWWFRACYYARTVY